LRIRSRHVSENRLYHVKEQRKRSKGGKTQSGRATDAREVMGRRKRWRRKKRDNWGDYWGKERKKSG